MNKSYKEGDTLFRSKPFVYVLSSKERRKRCDQCLKKSDKLLRCSACKLPRYCSSECQRSAWKMHKDECGCLRRVSPNIPTDSVRLMYRLLLKLQKHGGYLEQEEVFGQKRCFDGLMSHSQEIKQDMKRLQSFVQLSQTLALYCGDSIDLPASDKLLEIFGKMVINSFGIYDVDFLSVGTGLYLGASVLDHSCCPNAVVIFSGTTATVRCIKAFNQSAQASIMARISYLDLMQTVDDRQQQLKSQYYFQCNCERCQDVNKNQLMLATVCSKGDCCGPVIEVNGAVSCQKCGVQCSDDECQDRRLCLTEAAKSVESAKRIQDSSEHTATSVLEFCEKKLDGGMRALHKNNVYVLQLKEIAFDACIDTEQWIKAVEYGTDLTNGYRQHLEVNNPVLGITLLKLGKLCTYLDKLSDAKNYLLEAQPMLLITHGRDHYLYSELSLLLEQVIARIRYPAEDA